MLRVMTAAFKLRWQISAKESGGFYEFVRRNLNTLASFCVITWIVRCATFSPGAIEGRDLWRTDSPFTSLLARHNMKMKVRRLLSAIDTVVLKREYPERLESVHQCFRNSLRCTRNSRTFLIGYVE